MSSPLLKLKEYKQYSTSTEHNIIDFVISSPMDVTKMSIQALAKKTYTSPSSVNRLCKSIGYEGFKDFKNNLLEELISIGKEEHKKDRDIRANDTIEDIIEKTTFNNIQSLEETMHLLDSDIISSISEEMHKAGKILLFGLGSSLEICNDIYIKFIRLNKTCTMARDYHTQLLHAYNSKTDDIAILVSYSGQTKEMLEIANELIKNGTTCVALTHYGSSPLSTKCKYSLYTASNESLFSCGTMSSRISQLNVIDILYNVYTSKYYEDSVKQLAKTHIKK